MERRSFLKKSAGVVGIAALGSAAGHAAAPRGERTTDQWQQLGTGTTGLPQRKKSLQFDVAVVGGGLAGVCAAVAAARNEAKTVLIQDRSVLGGNASSEIRVNVNGVSHLKPDWLPERETGIIEEILLGNRFQNPQESYSVWDHVIYDFATREPNLEVVMNTQATEAIMDGETIRSAACWQSTTETEITNPPQRQQMAVRRKLLKMLCLMRTFQRILLETADRHKHAVMPGYTHIRHAQPTTLGHYLLSVHDPLDRSVNMLEDSYRAMSLNELGCGALAGTSTAAAANIMAVMSRMALEMEHWSTLEYDMIDFEIGAGSFMMPNKRSNQGILEETTEGTARTLGALMEVAAMGTKLPHGDMNPIAYGMKYGTYQALDMIDRCVEPYLYKLPTMIVHEEKMLALARRGYSCSTELANVLVRTNGLDYRTAHEIVSHFVVESAKQGIPSSEAEIELLQQAVQNVIEKELKLTETELRRALDPVHFVNVTRSPGGVSPEEVTRMIAERAKRLDAARSRNLDRIDRLHAARRRMLADLKAIYEAASGSDGR